MKRFFIALFLLAIANISWAQVTGVTQDGDISSTRTGDYVDKNGQKTPCPELSPSGEMIDYNSAITEFSATLTGTNQIDVSVIVSAIGNADAVGFEYSTASDFATSTQHNITPVAAQRYEHSFTTLPLGTYYVRAYIRNCHGYIYSSAQTIDVVEALTITFDANGGTGTMENQEVASGVATALTANAFSRTNAVFMGWNTERSGCGDSFADAASFTATRDTTLYAQWRGYCPVAARLSNENGASATRVDSVQDHDGNWYEVVRIGNQCWLRENMRATTSPKTGSSIVVSDNSKSDYAPKAYYYDNLTTNVRKKGLLYNWYAAVDSTFASSPSDEVDLYNRRGICPEGWHVPNHQEWVALEEYMSHTPFSAVPELGSMYPLTVNELTGGCDWPAETTEGMPGVYSATKRNATLLSVEPTGYFCEGSFHFIRDMMLLSIDDENNYMTGMQSSSRIRFTDNSIAASTHMFGNAFIMTALGVTENGIYQSGDNDGADGYTVRCVRNGGTSSTQYLSITEAQLPYNFAGTTFPAGTESGTYIVATTNAAGCDSIITLNLKVCPATVDDVDGNTYNVLALGSQCWTKENLKTTKYADGTPIVQGTTNSTTVPYWYYPGNSSSYKATYGLLYNWRAAMSGSATSSANPSNVQGVCPTGWHLPSNAEWTQLTDYVSSQSGYQCSSTTENIAKALAATTGWNTNTTECTVGNTPSANNATGFGAIPAGYYDNSSKNRGSYAFYWSATQRNNSSAYARNITNTKAVVGANDRQKEHGNSVRCVYGDGVFATASTQDICITTAQLPYNFADTTFAVGTTSGTYTLIIPNAYGGDSIITLKLKVSPVTVDDIDGNTYNVLVLGNQCWTKENLKTTRYADGVSIANGTTNSTTTPYWYYPNNSADNKADYGLFYNWRAAMGASTSSAANPSNVQGICPNGWHLPSDAEWTQLTDYVSSQNEYQCGSNSSYIAKALASTTGWRTSTAECAVGNDPSSNNATGFGAMPAGEYSSSYTDFGTIARFMSSTEHSIDRPWGRFTMNSMNTLNGCWFPKYSAYSVRCVYGDGVLNTCFTTTSTQNLSISSTQLPYTFADTTFAVGTTSGTYRVTTTNACGGDSIITLNLKVCPTSVSDVEGNTYSTVMLGSQCWMAENLKTTQYSNGTSIEQGTEKSTTTPYWYYPDNNSTNKEAYGLLYNWRATMAGSASSAANPSDVQGICPTGWHVPSDAEWTQLTDYVSSQSEYQCASTAENIAKALASTTGWESDGSECAVGNDPSSNNATGFGAMPAGPYPSNSYDVIGRAAFHWSASEYDNSSAHFLALGFGISDVYRYHYDKYYGFPVRCVLGDGVLNTCFPTTSTQNVCISSAQLPYTFAGHTFDAGTVTGTYTVTTTNACGGDSIITINLRVAPATVDDVDGNSYNVIGIGSQCWTKENMKATTYANGVSIANGTTTSTTTPYWYYPDNNADNKEEYGLLYNWKAVMGTSTSSSANPSNVQGICPTGWHVPSDAEWTQLTDYVSSQSEYLCSSNSTYIAKAISSNIGWNTNSSECTVGNDLSANNGTGFSALPTGSYDGSYYLFSRRAAFWGATDNGSIYAYARGLYYNGNYVGRGTNNKYAGFSVRCVWGDGVLSACAPTSSTQNVCITSAQLPYTFAGHTFDAGTVTGTYTVTTTNACGGDSIITLNLQVAPATVDDVDGNTYNVIGIGNQCWTKENMKTTKYANGISIANGSTNSKSTPYWYYPANSSSTKETFGLLYNWLATMGASASSSANPSNVQGICPTGWHVPSDAEWTQLTDYVSSQSAYQCASTANNIAKALASTTEWGTYATDCAVGNDLSSNNATGFGAMPAGHYSLGGLTTINTKSYMWSATEASSDNANSRRLDYVSAIVSSFDFSKDYGMSVRCVLGEGVLNTRFTTTSSQDLCITSAQLPYIFADSTFAVGTTSGTYTVTTTNHYGGDSIITLNLSVAQILTSPCTPATVTDVDGNTYNTVSIGSQCWMAENLKTTKYANGTSISNGTDTSSFTPYWYYPNNSASNKSAYGLLYNWRAMMGCSASSAANPSNVQGICPTGWHVPSDAEWTQLFNNVESQDAYICASNTSYIAKALCSTTGWEIIDNEYDDGCSVGNGLCSNNATGFSAMPTGYYDRNGYSDFGEFTHYWGATDDGGGRVQSYYLRFDGGHIGSNASTLKNSGYPVRCVRGEGVLITCLTTTSTQNVSIASAQLPYDFADTTFAAGTTSGTYTLVRTNAAGCDSIITLNLTVWVCPATVADVDGNTYNVIGIGSQCWTKENLKTTKYADGVAIHNGTTTSMTVPYWYYPGNSSSNKATYGLLYNWRAMMGTSASSSANPSNVQGVCPTGWHLPSDAEWAQLFDYVGSQSEYQCASSSTKIAKALASTTGWSTSSNDCAVGNTPSSNNTTGFGAMPAGNIGAGLGDYASYWSTTETRTNAAYHRLISSSSASVLHDDDHKDAAYPVRCIYGEGVLSTCPPTSSTQDLGIYINQLPYIFADTTFETGTVSGVYNVTTTNACGGDSIITLNLTVCPATVDDVDGNTYNVLALGNQCWTKENMKSTKYSNGVSIANGSTNSKTTPYWYYPDNNSSNKDSYGLLYNWLATMGASSSSTANPSNVQGICPEGWHVPSDAEWTQLTDYVSSQSAYQCASTAANIAKALASTTGWDTSTVDCSVGNDLDANNTTGFGAMPAGLYSLGGPTSINKISYMWSATEYDSDLAESRRLDYNYASVSDYGLNKGFGMSVRCVWGEGVLNTRFTTTSSQDLCITSAQLPYVFADSTFAVGTTSGTYTVTTTNHYGGDSIITLSLSVAQILTSPCTPATVTDIDGNTYNTVQLGTKCWMAENLRTTKYADGTAIPQGGNSTTVAYWYYPNNSASNKDAYGLLYNWPAVMNGSTSTNANPSGVQGVCPNGWHVPSEAEWNYLKEDYMVSIATYKCDGSSSKTAKALSSIKGWNSSTTTCAVGNDLCANDASGFDAMPAGFFNSSSCVDFGNSAQFWSATQTGNVSLVYYIDLESNMANTNKYSAYKNYGMSVRCVRD